MESGSERVIEVFCVSNMMTHVGWKPQFSEYQSELGNSRKGVLQRGEALGI